MASENDYKASELLEAQAHLYRVLYSFLNPMSIKWANDLGIPDIIHKHGQPITLSELVLALKVPHAKATCVQRLMRLLTHNGFFAIINTNDNNNIEAYALTPASQLLVTSTDHCLSPMIELLNITSIVNSYYHLAKWTCGDDLTVIETALGTGPWDTILQNPSHLKKFNKAMECESHFVRFALNDCKSVFEGLDSIVDVGGGTGNTAKIICEGFPNLKYAVLDLPQVVEGLTGTKNLNFVGGNMFESIPHADAVLLKWVLHNWSDDDCIKILKNCKDAISGKGKGGKVIIIDIVINEKKDEHKMMELKLLLDVYMMASLNGKERDENDWKRVFMEAGFKHYNICSTFGFWSLVELYP